MAQVAAEHAVTTPVVFTAGGYCGNVAFEPCGGEMRDAGKLVLREVQPDPVRKFARSAEDIGADPLHAFLIGFERALAIKSPHEVVALPIVRPAAISPTA